MWVEMLSATPMACITNHASSPYRILLLYSFHVSRNRRVVSFGFSPHHHHHQAL